MSRARYLQPSLRPLTPEIGDTVVAYIPKPTETGAKAQKPSEEKKS